MSTDAASWPPIPLATLKAVTLSGAFPMAKPGEEMLFNSARLHRAELPGANGITNAHSLASIYALLIGDVDENETKKKRLISEQTLTQAITNVTPAQQPDQILFGLPSVFGKGGFQLHDDYFNIFGDGMFGHKGKLCIDICYLCSTEQILRKDYITIFRSLT